MYSNKLYAACKYMNDNKEEFKDFKIYSYLNNPSMEHDKKTDEASNNTKRVKPNNIMVIHNKLSSIFNFLIGSKDEKGKCNETSIKGADILLSMDISNMEDKVLAQILASYYNCIEKSNIKNFRMHETSINIEKSRDILNYFKPDDPNIEDDFNSAWLFINSKCRLILQFVIQRIIRNRANPYKKESIIKINNTILDLIDKEKEIPKVKFETAFEEMLFKIHLYYHTRDLFLENINILKLIKSEEVERKNPTDDYSLFSFSPAKKGYTWKQLQNFFREGDTKCIEKLSTFKRRISNSNQGIYLFNNIALRNIDACEPVSLKAIYREIYINQTSYKGNSSKAIFHKLLKSGKLNTSEVYFLTEKINTGIFREYGLIDEFYIKNELQENLYYLVCLILAKLKPADIVERFQESYGSIMFTLSEINTKYPYVPSEVNELKEWKELIHNLLIHETDFEVHNNEYIFEGMYQRFKLYNLKFKHGEI